MTPVLWMGAGSGVSCLLELSVLPPGLGREVVAGMLAPLAATAATWVVVLRAWRADPGSVAAVLMRLFGIKVAFFVGYVAVALTVFGLRPAPFAVSFTTYFIALYLAEALLFSRLFTRTLRQAR